MSPLGVPTILSRRSFLAAAGAAATLTTVGIPAGPAYAQRAGVLRFGLSSFPPNLAPFEYTGTASLTVKLALYRSLMSYGQDGSVKPEIAASIEHPDPLTYTFRIRDNAVFHDGSPVEGEDVKFSYELITAANSKAYLRADMQVIDRIEVVDPKTVRITLKEPTVTFIQVLASGYAPIVSRASKAPDYIGAGPFVLEKAERGSTITVRAFPNFYNAGYPKVGGIQFVAIPDESLRIAALESGDIDLIEYVSTQQMARIEDGPSTHIASVDGPFMYLMFNTVNGPFRDPRLRQAVNYAVDRNGLNKFAFSGMGSPIDGLPVPSSPAYDPALVKERFSFDIAKAKALMKQAGVGSLTIELLSTAQYAQHNDTALVVQQNLAAVGINANLRLPDWASRVALGNEGKYHIGVNGTAGAYNDPDAVSTYLDGRQAPSYTRAFGYDNKDMDALLARGRAESENARRAEIYAGVERILINEVPILPLLWRPQAYGLRDRVKNFAPLPGFLSFQSALRLEQAELS